MKKIIIPIVIALSLIIGIGWFFFYNKVNAKYPDVHTVSKDANETLTYGEVEYVVKECEVLTYDEMKTKYSDKLESYKAEKIEDSSFKYILVDLQVKNIGNEDKSLELYEYVLSTKTTSNGLDMELFEAFNDINMLVPTVGPGEQANIELAYSFVESYFFGHLNKEEDMKPEDFELVMKLYPKKYAIRLG